MPFKLKLKKTRQYNVASKSLFVISVELLDGGVADCTLSVDSTGQECLDNVCQLQAINQPEFFGLRYINRGQLPRWVQPDRPLKRQLDKHSSSHQLYLRVMYYVISGTSLITDELTRYHYFLQLKNDLIEGRIICDFQQAVVLASYSRQAEYGNHDRERHTVEYLKNLLTFPKQMIDGGQLVDVSTLAETGRLEWLTAAVIQHHMTLHNMSQAQAEEGFITTCQQLRGYGQEMFTAKEQRGQGEVTIAVSLTGIRVLNENSETPHFYRWADITNVINYKRTFTVECQRRAESAAYVLASAEDGKYVWRMCVQQHTFYMRHRDALGDPPAHPHPHSHPHHQHQHHHQQALEHRTNFQEYGLSDSREELDSREPLDPREAGGASRLEALTPSHRAHSTSCLELAEQHHHHQQQQQQQQQLLRNRALLPSYRPAPDYETAVQLKYQQQRAEAQLRYQAHPAHPHPHPHSHAHPHAHPKPLAYGSHPDIHRVHYPDVTRHTVSVNRGLDHDDYAYGIDLHAPAYPFAVSAAGAGRAADLDARLRHANAYKPPPPYPANGLASNSTPDLAVAGQALSYRRGYVDPHVSGSSPDLVSTRSALTRRYVGYVAAHAHGTYDDLAAVLAPTARTVGELYDERGNVVYPMPYRRHLALPPSDAPEPIYENVPLPWRAEPAPAMRDRARSLTTTDELARLHDRHAVGNGNVRPAPAPAPAANPRHPELPTSDAHPHYMNAHIIRETSVPKDLNLSKRSIERNDAEFDNVASTIDRLSLKQEGDETPYQSLSAPRAPADSAPGEHVTSVSVPDVRPPLHSTSVEVEGGSGNNTSVSASVSGSASSSTVSSKEKKRRRWGVFMGRGPKAGEGRSATLGRQRERDRERAGAAPVAQVKHRWSTDDWPKFHPLPPSITKENLCQLLERKMADDQLSFAFEQIPKGRAAGGEVRTALLPAHAPLNGPAGGAGGTAGAGAGAPSLPYDDNRVKLHPTPANPHGYINASHVTMTVGNMQRFYVVMKVVDGKLSRAGPVGAAGVGVGASVSVEAAALVWECAWQVGARLVAHVGGDEPLPYLPPDNTTADYGKFQVSCGTSSLARWGGSVRVRVRVRAPGGGGGAGGGRGQRALWHVRYSRWTRPDPADNDVPYFLQFLSELNALRLSCESEAEAEAGAGAGRDAPLVIGCGEGAGRCGVALAADLLLHILDNNQELDIPRTVGLLHQQRANLVQTVPQYRFLHLVLLQYLRQSRLI